MDYPTYKEHAQKERYLRSIKNNIIALLAADSEERHKRDLLDICIWQITEIDGKYNTRYRSEGAMDKKNWHEVQHEHVYCSRKLKMSQFRKLAITQAASLDYVIL